MGTFKQELEVDTTTLRFTPLGLSLGGLMRPADSQTYLEKLIEPAQLDADVPVDVKTSFDRLRQLHVHGLFDYGFFTLAVEASWLLPEAALGLRFLEVYQDGVPFVRGDERRLIQARSYETVVHSVGPRGEVRRRNGWSLEGDVNSGGRATFDASYRALLRWANREGLLSKWLDDRWHKQLPGIADALKSGNSVGGRHIPHNWDHLNEREQREWLDHLRASVWEPLQLNLFVEIRNLVAHRSVGSVQTPIDSANALRSVAALLNSLWDRSSAHNKA